MKKKFLSKLLTMLLVASMVFTLLPVSTMAAYGGWSSWGFDWSDLWNWGEDDTTDDAQAADGELEVYDADIDTYAADDYDRIVHLDCGRKYFSVENIEKLIDTMAKYGYNQLQLAFGNDGFRFLLDDMSLSFKDENGSAVVLTSDIVKENIKNGNVYYCNDNQGEKEKFLSQDDMDTIIAHAEEKGIEIVPMINMPGHMVALLYGQDNYKWAYNGSKYPNSLNIDDATSRNYAYAILQKYVTYFADKGCKYFNFGADEFANGGGDMNCGTYNNNPAYYWFTDANWENMQEFMNGCIDIITSAETAEGRSLTARCFNDAICYNNNAGHCGNVSENVEILYWGSGWSGFSPATTRTLQNNGYQELLNNHGSWYYVLKADNEAIQKPSESNNYSSFSVTSFPDGNTVSNPIGAVFCIWCDNYDRLTDDQVMDINHSDNALTQVAAMAKQLWNATDPVEEEFTVTDPDGGTKSSIGEGGTLTLTANSVAAWTVDPEDVVQLSTTEESLSAATSVTVTALNAGTAHVTAESENHRAAVYTVTVTAAGEENTQNISVAANGEYRIENVPGKLDEKSYTVSPEGYATVEVTSVPGTGETVYEQASLAEGTFYVTNGNTATANSPQLKFTANDDGTYYIQNSNGKYIYPNYSTYTKRYSLATAQYDGFAESVKVDVNSDGSVTISRDVSGRRETKTCYLNLDGTGFSASGSSSKLYLYKQTQKPAGYTSTIVFKGLNATPDDVTPSVKIGDTTYYVTVTPESLDDAKEQQVELWITNRKLYDNGSSATGNHTLSLEAGSYYGTNGAELSGVNGVPETIDQDGKTYVFWKGVVLHDGDRQFDGDSADKKDKSSSGTDFYKMCYQNGAWQYLDGTTWTEVKDDDTVIAYYLQQFPITKEVKTLTRDYGDAPSNNHNATWADAWTATGFAVVRPGNVLSRTDEEIYENLMMRGWKSGEDYDGFGEGKQSVGIIYAENNSEYQVEKITITKGTNIYSNGSDAKGKYWPKATGSNNYVKWDRVMNDAGQEWFNETVVWSADDPDTYGVTPILNGLEHEEYCFDENNKCFLILVYLKAVEKETNLNFRYVERSSGEEIYSAQIPMTYTEGSAEPTYTDTLKNGAGSVIGSTKNWPGTTVGASDYLPDDAYVENSQGYKQTFNKKISTFSDIDPKYKSGLYKYDGAEISNDGKTLTLYYTINTDKLRATYVIDFGLPLYIPLSDLIENQTVVEQVYAKGENITNTTITTEYGTLMYDSASQSIVYTMNKPFDSDGMLTAGFQFKYKGTEVLSQAITIGVLPASNVLYEENFLTKGDPSSSDWQKVESDQPLGNQQPQKVTTDEELLKGYSVFGYDTAYADKANQLGVWSVDSLEAGKGLSSALTTEFYGKGFDLIGNCGPDTGRVLLLLTNKETNKGMLLDIDTRYNDGTGEYGETTLHQVPLAHVMLDEEATYKAAIYAGGKLETTVSTQYAAMPVASYDTDLYSVLAENGLTMADVEYVKVSGAEAASAAASTNGIAVYSAPAAYAAADTTVKHKAGTHVEIDGFRVYRSSTDNINYPESERNVTYWNILDVVKDEIVAYREGEGTASASVSVKDYEKTGGPQNEIYLKPGQSVAFKLKGSSIMSVQVSLRAVDGVSSWNDNTISSNTEMYYTLDKDSNDNFVISVPESTTDMLAIGNVKLLNSVTADDIVAADGIETEELLMSIRMAMSAASVEPDQPEPSLEFVPEYVSIRDYATPLFRSKLVTLRIDFSSDVSYVTIDGVRYDPSRLASWFGYHTVTFTDRISRNADYFYKIVFFDADGNPSETHVVQGK